MPPNICRGPLGTATNLPLIDSQTTAPTCNAAPVISRGPEGICPGPGWQWVPGIGWVYVHPAPPSAPKTKAPPSPNNDNNETEWWEDVGEGVIDGVAGAPQAIVEDIYYGGKRVIKEQNSVKIIRWIFDRDDYIAEEEMKKRFAEVISALFRDGIYEGGFKDLVTIILEHWYEPLPDCAKEKLMKDAGSIALETGSAFTSKTLAKAAIKKILEKMINKLVTKVVASKGVQMLLTRVGVSGAAASTGVGIPVAIILTVLGFAAMMEKAMDGAKSLKSNHPKVYEAAKSENVDLLFFMVSEPMHEYLEHIALAKKNKEQYQTLMKTLYCS